VKHWLGLFGILAMAAVVAVAVTAIPPNSKRARQRAQFDKIQVGMTEKEVVELMGPPVQFLCKGIGTYQAEHFGNYEELTWFKAGSPAGSYQVHVDAKSRVVVAVFPPRSTE
jgi:hypothetical protein